ncbi:MAG: hypothetical protein ACOC8K_08540 [Gemmatimonadota bacterium]
MTRLSAIAALWLLIASVPTHDLAAQATGLPTFVAPTRAFGTTELGVTLSRPGGSAIALEGRFGVALDRADLAVRGGYADPGGAGDGSFIVGVEARVPVIGRSATFPLDGAFVFGVGRRFESGGGQTFVPIGLSLGRRLSIDGDALQITPYVEPTVVFESSSLFAMGLGLDVRIRGIPEVRVNRAAGDMDGFSVGLFWPQ